MARNTEASQQIIISAATKEEKHTKENTTHLRQWKRTQHKSTKQSVKTLKFNNNLINQHKHNTSPSLRCSRKNRMTGNKLYEANHLCMMKIALIKEKKLQENHHLKISFIHSKDDLSC